ncbi:MAG: ATPase, T2SS/T4P/T4SS family, partial [Elusimicrobiota bacterium]|nr:ATPase, T2SS/T4P/T4SS family [Elusimicrobiota bacterium]
MAVKHMALKKKLGDLLVEVGIITPQQLQDAMEEQKRKGGKLGLILMSLGYITEDVLLAFLGKQCGVSYVSLSEYGEITEDIIKSVPESVVRHQTLLPIAREGNVLTIAMADPLNVFATDDLRLMTGNEINVVIASEAEIKAAIEKYYGTKASMETLVKDMEAGGAEASVDVVTAADAGKDIVSLEAAGEDAPIVKIVNLLLGGAVKTKASDIHIEPYEKSLRVRYRIDGVLHEVSAPPKKTQNAIVSRIKIMANLDIAERRLPQDGRI